MSKVEKRELWEEARAYFQANTVKGGRYLNDAGKIINDCGDAYYDSTVGLDGLRFSKPKKVDVPDEITVDINRVWIACYGPNCVKRTKETAEAITKTVSRHIGVDSYSRLGFRVHYYKHTKNVKTYTQGLYAAIIASEMKTLVGSPDRVLEMVSRVRFLNPPFSIWLGVQPITISRPPDKISDFADDGVIIDIDVAESKDSSTRPLNLNLLATFLREASDRVVEKAAETIGFLEEVETSARGA